MYVSIFSIQILPHGSITTKHGRHIIKPPEKHWGGEESVA